LRDFGVVQFSTFATQSANSGSRLRSSSN
jgi:hypothetical protein